MKSKKINRSLSTFLAKKKRSLKIAEKKLQPVNIFFILKLEFITYDNSIKIKIIPPADFRS